VLEVPLSFDFRSLVVDLSFEYADWMRAIIEFKAAVIELRTGVHFPYLTSDFSYLTVVTSIFGT